MAVRTPGHAHAGRWLDGGRQGTVALRGEGSGPVIGQQMCSTSEACAPQTPFTQGGPLLLCPWPCPCVLNRLHLYARSGSLG